MPPKHGIYGRHKNLETSATTGIGASGNLCNGLAKLPPRRWFYHQQPPRTFDNNRCLLKATPVFFNNEEGIERHRPYRHILEQYIGRHHPLRTLRAHPTTLLLNKRAKLNVFQLRSNLRKIVPVSSLARLFIDNKDSGQLLFY